jgi:hypothetical protein
VSLFDDQTAKPGAARGIVYDVKVSTAGGACDGGTAPAATTAWQFKEMGTSLSAGSFRISADGSRIIGWGDSFVPGHVFTEVDVHGVDLLDFYFTDDGSISYRAVKVPLTTFDLRTLRATAGLP